jgi:hypothetical protein
VKLAPNPVASPAGIFVKQLNRGGTADARMRSSPYGTNAFSFKKRARPPANETHGVTTRKMGILELNHQFI